MSDEDRDIDIESDDDDDSISGGGGARTDLQFASQAEKRAHHNALERKRRDHIKDSFCSLRDSVPALQGEKASRAQILKKAADYIEFMRRKHGSHQQDIEDLKKQNKLLESQIRSLEKTKYAGNFAAMSGASTLNQTNNDNVLKYDGSASDTSDSEIVSQQKRMKT